MHLFTAINGFFGGSRNVGHTFAPCDLNLLTRRCCAAFNDIYVADEIGHINGVWRLINPCGGIDLNHAPFIHDGDSAGNCHCFFLVMGHNHKCCACFFLNIHQFKLGILTQFFVQRAKWFIQQQQLWRLGQ